MRILIDGTPLLLPGGGVKSYVHYWLEHLLRSQGQGERIDVFPFLSGTGDLNHQTSNFSATATAVRLALVRTSNVGRNPMLRLLSGSADIFHESNTHILNPPRAKFLTATIHDMTCWVTPEFHSPENVIATKRFAARVLARADRLIAVSENTRQDAAEILRIPFDRIEVIYPGVAGDFFSVASDETARARIKFGLLKPYILFAGVIEPRKNVGTLLDAYTSLPSSIRSEFDLVIAGRVGWEVHDVTRRLNDGIQGLRFLNYVQEADLPGLTAGATAFVYPSNYEGFGLPVAQAMAAGLPVVTSNVSSLPEITGGAAMLVDPNDSDQIRDALSEVLLSPSLQQTLAERSSAKASDFHWDDCARKSLRFFRAISEN